MTTSETKRIRWEDQPEPGGAIGYVGTQDSRAFTIWPPLTDEDEWLLSCAFSHMATERCFGSDRGELEAKAESWLAEFVTSIGAVFKAPDLPPPNRGPMRDLTCGACGEEFGTNFDVDKIDCPRCEARRCPCCGDWFGAEW